MKHVVIFLFLLASFTVSAQDCPSECELYVPNTLTPDCDGIDCDLFRVESECSFDEFELFIFNRWGNKIFQSDDPEKQFRAQDESDGTYMWMIKGKFCNGDSISKTGHVTIIR